VDGKPVGIRSDSTDENQPDLVELWCRATCIKPAALQVANDLHGLKGSVVLGMNPDCPHGALKDGAAFVQGQDTLIEQNLDQSGGNSPSSDG
jgi:hypothetical protein